MKTKDNLGLKGFLDVTIKRANGKIEKFHIENTIQTGLKDEVNSNIWNPGGVDISLDTLFADDTTPPTALSDGIILRTTDATPLYYMMNCSIAHTNDTTTVTGTITDVSKTFDSAKLGHNFSSNFDFAHDFALPTSWDNVILQAADTLTIEWTIDCAP